MTPENILDRIVKDVRNRLEKSPVPADLEKKALDAAAERMQSRSGVFCRALAACGPTIIAECKHASPSAGILRDPFDPAALSKTYASAGASAISVVTERDHFRGSLRWISEVRKTTDLPVLRKDFIFTRRQLLESVLSGADAVLLIQRILEESLMEELVGLAGELGLEVLLEVFVDEDPSPAIKSDAMILGVNARNLATFETRLDLVADMAGRLPGDRILVAESGIKTAEDVRKLMKAGFCSMLVGETLLSADDPGEALRRLLR